MHQKSDLATIERAYNMLADPELRAVYNELRRDPTIPVPFPYSGFGSLLAAGRASRGERCLLREPNSGLHARAPALARFQCLSANSTISTTSRSCATGTANLRCSSTISCSRSDGIQPGVSGAISSLQPLKSLPTSFTQAGIASDGGEWKLDRVGNRASKPDGARDARRR